MGTAAQGTPYCGDTNSYFSDDNPLLLPTINYLADNFDKTKFVRLGFELFNLV